MKNRTLEIIIDQESIVPCDPGDGPKSGNELLTIFDTAPLPLDPTERVQLPPIHSNGEHLSDPSPEDLDSRL